ncbi:MAG: hypothetical protein JW882_16665 [Deltaproteobacteria bacterium]|nr:hypothetical protein [Deltaproteobacteria bacterium]
MEKNRQAYLSLFRWDGERVPQWKVISGLDTETGFMGHNLVDVPVHLTCAVSCFF